MIRRLDVGRVARFLISEAIQEQHDCDKGEVSEVIDVLELRPRCEVLAVVVLDFPAQLRSRKHNQHKPKDEQQAGRRVAFDFVHQLEKRGNYLRRKLETQFSGNLRARSEKASSKDGFLRFSKRIL